MAIGPGVQRIYAFSFCLGAAGLEIDRIEFDDEDGNTYGSYGSTGGPPFESKITSVKTGCILRYFSAIAIIIANRLLSTP